MIRLLLPLCAALALAGCDTPRPASAGSVAVNTGTAIADATLPPPVAYADRTTMDEATVLTIEKGVEAAADLATLAVKAGVVKGAQLATVARLSAQTRAALVTLRAAYSAGNATSYADAATRIRGAIDAIRSLTKGDVR
jgi:hypothetical protein